MASENQELRIPTPYGQISCKIWGTDGPGKERIMAIHGWMDNAGTFDRLIPLLDLDNLYIVAIDLPGHGLSSHLPKGVYYSDITWIIEIKRVLDFLQWNCVTLLAHSMGANASLNFATFFPDTVKRVITFDTVKPAVFDINELAYRKAEDISNFLKHEEMEKKKMKTPEQGFKYDNAIRALIVAHSPIGELKAEGASCLLKRAAKLKPNSPIAQYIFTRDTRLNCILNRKIDCESLKQLYAQIKCELLIINGKSGLWFDRDIQKQFIELYREKCKRFVYVEVEGDHYVHLTKPENVASHINEFLKDL